MRNILKRIILENQEQISRVTPIIRNVAIPDTPNILVFTGIRRCGKTYLLYQLAQQYKKEEVLFIDFDDERLLPIHSSNNYDMIIDSYKELFPQITPIIFFDEIQSLPHWHLYVKRLYARGLRIAITGSNSHLLSREIATFIEGRAVETRVHPFSFDEYLRLKQVPLTKNDIFSKGAIISSHLIDYLSHGGFGEVINSKDKRLILKGILDLVLYKDLASRFNYNTYGLKLLFSKLIENTGKPFSLSSLTNKINPLYPVSRPTLIDYFHSLELPFLTSSIGPFRQSVVMRESERKTYTEDTGFITLMSVDTDNLGKLLETAVYHQLRRKYADIYYYKTHRFGEVDFFVNNQLVQVCYSLQKYDTRQREIESLSVAMNETGIKKGLIITWDDTEEIPLENGYHIQAIPLREWLLS